MDKKEVQQMLREKAAAKKEKELKKAEKVAQKAAGKATEKAEKVKIPKQKSHKKASNDLFLKVAVFGAAIILVGLCVYVVRLFFLMTFCPYGFQCSHYPCGD